MLETQRKMYYFYKQSIKNQLTFQSKNITVDVNICEGKENTFWHISSLTEDSIYKSHEIFPCVNHKSTSICKIDCSFSHSESIVVKVHSQNRLFCVYRCMSINLIVSIFKKIETGEIKNIKAWKNIDGKVLIRYTEEEFDYLIVLTESRNSYKLITAYPLFLKREKEKNNKQYNHFNTTKLI